MSSLCRFCSECFFEQFPLSKNPADCFICEGKFNSLDSMLEIAAKLLIDSKSPSFLVSSSIPKEFLVNEDHLFDQKFTNDSRSIKFFLNKVLSSRLRELTKLKTAKDSFCTVVFDFTALSVDLVFSDLFIFGRYKKHAPNISQSRWTCGDCEGSGCDTCNNLGKNYVSVEELIGNPSKALSNAREYSLHASGREDVDVTNSAGRAFVLELKNAQTPIFDLSLLEKRIALDGLVSVTNLLVVDRGFVEIVTESHFDKTYVADISFDRELTKEEFEKILSLNGTILHQRTPNRVKHRRSDLIRKRKIIDLKILSFSKNSAKIQVTAEAGTYIKELISSDEGRTSPSVSGVLNCASKCEKLEVTKIEDSFLDFVSKSRNAL